MNMLMEKNEVVSNEVIAYRRKNQKMQRMLKDKNLCIKIMAASIVVMMLFIAFTVISDASTPTKIYSVTTTEYWLSDGDTLWDLANEFKGDFAGTTNQWIVVVCKMNGIVRADHIEAHRYITIPTYVAMPEYDY